MACMHPYNLRSSQKYGETPTEVFQAGLEYQDIRTIKGDKSGYW
jgi:hypothetical protein